MTFLNSMKARAVAALVVFLALSQILALLVYVARSEDANNLLHDALVAQHIALIAKLVDKLPESDRTRITGLIDAPSLHVSPTANPALESGLPEGTRPHIFEHLLGAFLDLPMTEHIRLAYSQDVKSSGFRVLQKSNADDTSNSAQ